MVTALIEAYDKSMNDVSEEELAQSGLFGVWLRQVASALLVANMELERQVWDEVRATKVSLHERKALEAYGIGMRAILLGVLDGLEQEYNHEP